MDRRLLWILAFVGGLNLSATENDGLYVPAAVYSIRCEGIFDKPDSLADYIVNRLANRFTFCWYEYPAVLPRMNLWYEGEDDSASFYVVVGNGLIPARVVVEESDYGNGEVKVTVLEYAESLRGFERADRLVRPEENEVTDIMHVVRISETSKTAREILQLIKSELDIVLANHLPLPEEGVL